jgi:hypothetical protein
MPCSLLHSPLTPYSPNTEQISPSHVHLLCSKYLFASIFHPFKFSIIKLPEKFHLYSYSTIFCTGFHLPKFSYFATPCSSPSTCSRNTLREHIHVSIDCFLFLLTYMLVFVYCYMCLLRYKLKFALVQAVKAKRGSKVTALLFL